MVLTSRWKRRRLRNRRRRIRRIRRRNRIRRIRRRRGCRNSIAPPIRLPSNQPGQHAQSAAAESARTAGACEQQTPGTPTAENHGPGNMVRKRRSRTPLRQAGLHLHVLGLCDGGADGLRGRDHGIAVHRSGAVPAAFRAGYRRPGHRAESARGRSPLPGGCGGRRWRAAA